MKLIFTHGNKSLADFSSIVHSYKSTEFNSHKKSTVPLLLFWKNYENEIKRLFKYLAIIAPDKLSACFEYEVPAQSGRGKPSYTDLMLLSDQTAIAIEAKYTEPPYDTVKKWLGKPISENRRDVLNGWISLIKNVTELPLTADDFHELPYQMVHRLASVCYPDVLNRILIYQVFNPDNKKKLYYENKLRSLSEKINSIKIYLMIVPILKSDAYMEFENEWDKGSRNLSEKVINGIIDGNFFTFKQSELVKF